VALARKADQHGLLLDLMSVLAICVARVDGVEVVNAAAGRVPFDDLIAHGEIGVRWAGAVAGTEYVGRWCGEAELNRGMRKQGGEKKNRR
jgi:hypothetical protein